MSDLIYHKAINGYINDDNLVVSNINTIYNKLL